MVKSTKIITRIAFYIFFVNSVLKTLGVIDWSWPVIYWPIWMLLCFLVLISSALIISGIIKMVQVYCYKEGKPLEVKSIFWICLNMILINIMLATFGYFLEDLIQNEIMGESFEIFLAIGVILLSINIAITMILKYSIM